MRINSRHDAKFLTIWKTFIVQCSHANTAVRYHRKPNAYFRDLKFSKTQKPRYCIASASSEAYFWVAMHRSPPKSATRERRNS